MSKGFEAKRLILLCIRYCISNIIISLFLMEVMRVISLCLNYFYFYCGLLLFFLRCSSPVAYRRIERPMFSWISNSSVIIAIKRKNSFSISFSIVCLFLQSSRLLDNVDKSSKSEVMQKQKSSRLIVRKFAAIFNKASYLI